jgi:hypothetical protein
MAGPFSGQSGNEGSNKSHVQQAGGDVLHDGAPGGLTFSESELPISGTFAHPMMLGGFSPSPGRTPQPQADDPSRGTGSLPPSGLRR